jgi:succinoglycan biosynthesis protein ExoV
MKLCYYLGNNFGDSLNPLLFSKLLPGFFDDNDDIVFLGIGSILGLEKGSSNTKKIIVFSSGYGAGRPDIYGEEPELTEKYDIRCVRGPLTAKHFNLDEKKAVCDGAILLPDVLPVSPMGNKQYKYSFIPHHVSENMFDRWEQLFKDSSIHLIHPSCKVEEVVDQIVNSECVITEAMHGAILADSYRVPWIPVKMYSHINSFKWMDWLASFNMNYSPIEVTSLFNLHHIYDLISTKTNISRESGIVSLLGSTYRIYQRYSLEGKVKKEFKRVKHSKWYLTPEKDLNEKKELLMNRLYEIKKAYQ